MGKWWGARIPNIISESFQLNATWNRSELKNGTVKLVQALHGAINDDEGSTEPGERESNAKPNTKLSTGRINSRLPTKIIRAKLSKKLPTKGIGSKLPSAWIENETREQWEHKSLHAGYRVSEPGVWDEEMIT